MSTATLDQLKTYVADVVELAERYGAIIHPPNAGQDIAVYPAGTDLILRLEMRLPAHPQSKAVELTISERWSPVGTSEYDRADYAYELRHRELDYRRAFHRHDVDHFVRSHDVATHEHCESTMGRPLCGHYFGYPVDGAVDGFQRLYGLWLADVKPDCGELRCLR